MDALVEAFDPMTLIMLSILLAWGVVGWRLVKILKADGDLSVKIIMTLLVLYGVGWSLFGISQYLRMS